MANLKITAGYDFLGLYNQKSWYHYGFYSQWLRSYGDFLIVVNALLWTARLKSP